jgi:predicted O-linked N-acetylglucosamine transferase (SPINDLY family)
MGRIANLRDEAAAEGLYRAWIAANSASPALFAAWFNLGVLRMNAGSLAEAEAAFREALRLNPGCQEARFNLGAALERLERVDEALAAWADIARLPDTATGNERAMLVMALIHSGRVLEQQKRLAEAEAMLERSLRLDPAQGDALHHWIYLRQKQCAWPVLKELPGISPTAMLSAASSLATLNLSDDPMLQRAASERFVRRHMTPDLPPLSAPGGYGHERLRVGYLSGDFKLHPVSMLMVELFERHHRDRVEVYGYGWAKDDGSELRRRVIAALDHHVDISGMTDEEAARRIRADEIDILVDLHGPTAGARPDIPGRRPAPVQTAWLGFPGPSAMACIDYVVCDRVLLPDPPAQGMVEKPLYMPEVFQVCDAKRPVGPAPTRAQCGLPEDGVVFCVFNNCHKYTPEMFAAWLEILARVPGSVLWVAADDASVPPNLRTSASGHGIAPERIVCAPRAVPADYLARYRVADLFLDCFPFNGGTTVNDALFMGLPVVTRMGRAFASRMAGSLLASLGLGELAVDSLAGYVELAVALGLDRQRLAQVRQRLETARSGAALFDTDRQAANLETLFEQACGVRRRSHHQPTPSMKQTPQNDIHNPLVLELMPHDSPMVVEIGSSSGALAKAYRAANPQSRYLGVEIDPEYAEASRRYCTEVTCGDVEKFSDAEFARLSETGVWVFADVLEHLYDPWRLLERIRACGPAGVTVVACIPNEQYWAVQSALNTGRLFYQETGLLDRTHIRWFTRLTIIDLFDRAGFRIEAMLARYGTPPSADMAAALRQMAAAAGINPEVALQDSTVFQYALRAVAKP